MSFQSLHMAVYKIHRLVDDCPFYIHNKMLCGEIIPLTQYELGNGALTYAIKSVLIIGIIF